MKRFSSMIKGISSILDKIAGICFFAVMMLIVANILLRSVLKHPILGTYELVGFLTALGVGLSLAHCAVQDGHIAVSLIIERVAKKIQAVVGIFVNLTSFGFWSLAVWYLCKYAGAMRTAGLVSSTAEIPVYPFIYLIALGLAGLCLVLLWKSVLAFKEIFESVSFFELAWKPKYSESVKKAMR